VRAIFQWLGAAANAEHAQALEPGGENDQNLTRRARPITGRSEVFAPQLNPEKFRLY
jgi:hypothetical protein